MLLFIPVRQNHLVSALSLNCPKPTLHSSQRYRHFQQRLLKITLIPEVSISNSGNRIALHCKIYFELSAHFQCSLNITSAQCSCPCCSVGSACPFSAVCHSTTAVPLIQSQCKATGKLAFLNKTPLYSC